MRRNKMPIVNYFGHGIDAERYSQARPYIHPSAVDKFRSFAHIDARLSRALDVGCGTGQSTVALTEIVKSVIGIDSSVDMLAHAVLHPNVEYIQSMAEEIPLADGQFDLITAAQAFHWFDHDLFLTESNRLLRLPGWLVIYTSWFTGEMKEEPSFSHWFRGEYLHRYPTPPRNRTEITETLAHKHSLILRGEDEFSNEVSMTIHRFVDYQLSTTNIIAAVERGTVGFEDAARWMQTSIAPFFADTLEKIFLFWGKIWYLEKTAA